MQTLHPSHKGTIGFPPLILAIVVHEDVYGQFQLKVTGRQPGFFQDQGNAFEKIRVPEFHR